MSTVNAIYEAILQAMRRGDAVALATIVRVKGSSPASLNSKMLVWRDGRSIGTVGGGCLEHDVRMAALDAMESGKSRLLTFELSAARAAIDGLICGGVVDVYVEPVAAPRLIIFGAGHIASEVAAHAKRLGFHVSVMDDREAHVNREYFPDADELIVDAFEHYTATANAPRDAYILILTRGHAHDADCLAWALKQNARYIGMIGSATKRDAIYALLRERGFSDEDFRCVRCPVGAAIGAETREEIGVSIAAELVQQRRLGRL